MTVRRLATFDVDGLLVGLDVLRVQEVLDRLPMTPVPRAPAAVVGLVNMRGRILAATDLRRRLGLQALEGDGRSVHVVVRSGSRLDSLVVDAVGDVLDLDAARREPVPDTVDRTVRAVTSGVHPLEGRLLLELDLDLVLAEAGAEGQVADAGTRR